MKNLPSIDQLAESYRIACRKPQDLEGWAFDNVPGLFARIRKLEKQVEKLTGKNADKKAAKRKPKGKK